MLWKQNRVYLSLYLSLLIQHVAATSCSKKDHVYSVTHSVLFKVISIQRRTVYRKFVLYSLVPDAQPLTCIVWVWGGRMRETILEQTERDYQTKMVCAYCGSHGLPMFFQCGWPPWQPCLTYPKAKDKVIGGVMIVYSASPTPRYRIISIGVPFLPPKEIFQILMSYSDIIWSEGAFCGTPCPWQVPWT